MTHLILEHEAGTLHAHGTWTSMRACRSRQLSDRWNTTPTYLTAPGMQVIQRTAVRPGCSAAVLNKGVIKMK